MACSLEEIKRDSLQKVKETFVSGNKSFKNDGEGLFISTDIKTSIADLYKIVDTAQKRVEDWTTEKFGNSKFSKNWVEVNRVESIGLSIEFKFPKLLEEAYNQLIEATNKRQAEGNRKENEEDDIVIEEQEIEEEFDEIEDILYKMSQKYGEKITIDDWNSLSLEQQEYLRECYG